LLRRQLRQTLISDAARVLEKLIGENLPKLNAEIPSSAKISPGFNPLYIDKAADANPNHTNEDSFVLLKF
jgi:hypothetical protein